MSPEMMEFLVDGKPQMRRYHLQRGEMGLLNIVPDLLDGEEIMRMIGSEKPEIVTVREPRISRGRAFGGSFYDPNEDG